MTTETENKKTVGCSEDTIINCKRTVKLHHLQIFTKNLFQNETQDLLEMLRFLFVSIL